MNKNIVLGITGSIAAYKALLLIRELKKNGYNVQVIATKNALEFVGEITLATLSENPVIKEVINYKDDYTKHISLAKWADIFVVAPATANFIAKAANGIADDFLSTFNLSFNGPKLIVPAMNKEMYLSRQNLKNIAFLKEYGYYFVEPGVGYLACGDIGVGRFPEVEEVYFYIEKLLTPQIFKGVKVLINGGRTVEYLDPIRILTNRATGEMGKHLAEVFASMGGEVIYLYGHVNHLPRGVKKLIEFDTTEDLLNKMIDYAKDAEIIISSAAINDFRPTISYSEKIKKNKKDNLEIKFEKTPDVLKEITYRYANKLIVAFALESKHDIEEAQKKKSRKNADILVLNSLDKSKVFGESINNYSIITDQKVYTYENISKKELAYNLTYIVKEIYENKFKRTV